MVPTPGEDWLAHPGLLELERRFHALHTADHLKLVAAAGPVWALVTALAHVLHQPLVQMSVWKSFAS